MITKNKETTNAWVIIGFGMFLFGALIGDVDTFKNYSYYFVIFGALMVFFGYFRLKKVMELKNESH